MSDYQVGDLAALLAGKLPPPSKSPAKKRKLSESSKSDVVAAKAEPSSKRSKTVKLSDSSKPSPSQRGSSSAHVESDDKPMISATQAATRSKNDLKEFLSGVGAEFDEKRKQSQQKRTSKRAEKKAMKKVAQRSERPSRRAVGGVVKQLSAEERVESDWR
jgi:thiamine pyrophosphate-dependent acetolactate synthase large subunit-like protein